MAQIISILISLQQMPRKIKNIAPVIKIKEQQDQPSPLLKLQVTPTTTKQPKQPKPFIPLTSEQKPQNQEQLIAYVNNRRRKIKKQYVPGQLWDDSDDDQEETIMDRLGLNREYYQNFFKREEAELMKEEDEDYHFKKESSEQEQPELEEQKQSEENEQNESNQWNVQNQQDQRNSQKSRNDQQQQTNLKELKPTIPLHIQTYMVPEQPPPPHQPTQLPQYQNHVQLPPYQEFNQPPFKSLQQTSNHLDMIAQHSPPSSAQVMQTIRQAIDAIAQKNKNWFNFDQDLMPQVMSQQSPPVEHDDDYYQYKEERYPKELMRGQPTVVRLPKGARSINVEKEQEDVFQVKPPRQKEQQDVIICDKPQKPKICSYCQTAAPFLHFRTRSSKQRLQDACVQHGQMLYVSCPVVPGDFSQFNTRIKYQGKIKSVICRRNEINPMFLMRYYEKFLKVEDFQPGKRRMPHVFTEQQKAQWIEPRQYDSDDSGYCDDIEY